MISAITSLARVNSLDRRCSFALGFSDPLTNTFEADPVKAARMMIDHIDAKRAALHLPGPMYEVPYAPRQAGEQVKAAG